MPGEMSFEFRFGKGGLKPREPRDGETPFDVVVIADLAGAAPPDRPFGPLRAVDAETFDEVFAATAPRLRLEDQVDLTLRSDGDFHPDRLLESLPALRALKSLGEVASDPASFPKDGGSTFERLLGESAAGCAPSAQERGIEAFIRGVVSKHLVPGSDPRQQEVQRALEAATAERLRGVLRQESFRRLEGSWAAVRRLAHRFDVGGCARLHVID